MKVKINELFSDNNDALIMFAKMTTFEASWFTRFRASHSGQIIEIKNKDGATLLVQYKRKLYYWGEVYV